MFGYLSRPNVIDWVLLQELAKNVDAYKLSVYLTRDNGGPARLVPWDLDLAFGQPEITSGSDELQRNHDFIADLFGVDARPYFRPPFGFHDERVDAIAADLGYTVPTLWYGSLADSAEIPAEKIVELATEWFQPQHIVIGHLNWLPVTTVFDRLRALVVERGLTTVTLNDDWTVTVT